MPRQMRRRLFATTIFLIEILLFNSFKAKAQTIATGGEHALFICNNNIPMSCGYNLWGQLGNGTTIDDSIPYSISSLTGITSVASSLVHSLFLKNDGTVWACGLNGNGELGIGSTISKKTTPVKIDSINGVIAIAVGGYHSIFLKNDGTVWTCGYNALGQLGDGSYSDRLSPVQITSLSNIVAIAGGRNHSLFLKSDSTVWGCGDNWAGEIGTGTTTPFYPTPVQVVNVTGISAIAAGWYHSLFLKNDSTVWACGYNNYGQLGDGTGIFTLSPIKIPSIKNIIKISAGGQHSLFLNNNDSVLTCGYNVYGQLGNGTIANDSVPSLVTTIGNVSGIAGGNNSSLFLKSDGTVFGCGENYYGQLGNGITTDFNPNPLPIQATSLCQVTTTIKENYIEKSISIYPNPFSYVTTIKTDLYLKNATLTIYNTLGQEIRIIKNISGQETTLHRDNLLNGIYFIRVTQDNKVIASDKLVIAD